MAKRCAACNLPMTVATMGDAASASSNDDSLHVVLAICQRCVASRKRVPPAVYQKMLNRAADRAMADPARYLCKTFADPGAARVALGLLAHPSHTLEALGALGWR